VVARPVELLIKKISNADGFQPRESCSNENFVIITVFKWGADAEDNELVRLLINRGCEVVNIFGKRDLISWLENNE
jgi:hypothetical protein